MTQVRVRIYHNISGDASFGLNSVFRTADTKPEGIEPERVHESGGRFSWKEKATLPGDRHALVLVFAYDAKPFVHVRNDSANGRAVERAQRAMLRWHERGYAVASVPVDGATHPYGQRCPACTVNEVLYRAFEAFNVGTDELAKGYRGRRLRSLSVGDVVEIDGIPYACESVGWNLVSKEDLRILPAAEAEPAIRAHYEFKPAERLSVTVPLDEGDENDGTEDHS